MIDEKVDMMNVMGFNRYIQNIKKGEHGVLLCKDYYLDSVYVVNNSGKNISICGLIKSNTYGDFIIGMDNILFIKRQPGLFNISGKVFIDNPDEVLAPEFKVIEQNGISYTSAKIYTIYVHWRKVPENCNRLARKAFLEFFGKELCETFGTMSVREMYNKIK